MLSKRPAAHLSTSCDMHDIQLAESLSFLFCPLTIISYHWRRVPIAVLGVWGIHFRRTLQRIHMPVCRGGTTRFSFLLDPAKIPWFSDYFNNSKTMSDYFNNSKSLVYLVLPQRTQTNANIPLHSVNDSWQKLHSKSLQSRKMKSPKISVSLQASHYNLPSWLDTPSSRRQTQLPVYQNIGLQRSQPE